VAAGGKLHRIARGRRIVVVRRRIADIERIGRAGGQAGERRRGLPVLAVHAVLGRSAIVIGRDLVQRDAGVAAVFQRGGSRCILSSLVDDEGILQIVRVVLARPNGVVLIIQLNGHRVLTGVLLHVAGHGICLIGFNLISLIFARIGVLRVILAGNGDGLLRDSQGDRNGTRCTVARGHNDSTLILASIQTARRRNAERHIFILSHRKVRAARRRGEIRACHGIRCLDGDRSRRRGLIPVSIGKLYLCGCNSVRTVQPLSSIRAMGSRGRQFLVVGIIPAAKHLAVAVVNRRVQAGGCIHVLRHIDHAAVGQAKDVAANAAKRLDFVLHLVRTTQSVDRHLGQRINITLTASRILERQGIAGCFAVDNQCSHSLLMSMENTLAKGLHIRNVYQLKRRAAKEYIVAKRELTIACIKGCKGSRILLECAHANRYRNTLIESHRFKCAVHPSVAGSESIISNLRNILTDSHMLDLLITFICIRKRFLCYRRHLHALDLVRDHNLILFGRFRSKAGNSHGIFAILILGLISQILIHAGLAAKGKRIALFIQNTNERSKRRRGNVHIYLNRSTINYIGAPAGNAVRQFDRRSRTKAIEECAVLHRSQLCTGGQIPRSNTLRIVKRIIADPFQFGSLGKIDCRQFCAVFKRSAADEFNVCTQFNTFQRGICMRIITSRSRKNAVANTYHGIGLIAGICRCRNGNTARLLALFRQANDHQGRCIRPAINKIVILGQCLTIERDLIARLTEHLTRQRIFRVKGCLVA